MNNTALYTTRGKSYEFSRPGYPPELMDYLHKHGYPTICGSVIQRLIHNRPTKYIDLIGEITVLEKEKKA